MLFITFLLCLKSDTILHGEANEFTYRILAYLLLGVVRIYSKKVEFLKHDFADMLRESNNFIAGKEIRSIKFHNSITIPERFELDAFNLDISEDQDVSRLATILGYTMNQQYFLVGNKERAEFLIYDRTLTSAYVSFFAEFMLDLMKISLWQVLPSLSEDFWY